MVSTKKADFEKRRASHHHQARERKFGAAPGGEKGFAIRTGSSQGHIVREGWGDDVDQRGRRGKVVAI